MNIRLGIAARELRLCAWSLALLLGAATVVQADPAESLARARALYSEASYDEALTALSGAEGPEAQQYRALCLLAVGRPVEAERALESLVSGAPTFTPSDGEMPPRMMILFTQTRQRVLPGVVRHLFAEAREHFQSKTYDKAEAQFAKVLALTLDPAVKDKEGIADLRLLASGFADLVKAAGPTASAPAPRAGNAASAPASAAPRQTLRSGPIVVRQVLPPWPGSAGIPPVGAKAEVTVRIGSDGKVKTATLSAKLHPLYDMQLLGAAQGWLYKPAMADGQPVESERVVVVNITGR